MKKLKRLFVFSMLTISCALLHNGCKYDEFLSATEPCGSDAQWNFDFETGALVISGEGAVEGTPYTDVMKSKISSVTISEGITSIGDTVFRGCENIKTVFWNARNCNRTMFRHTNVIHLDDGTIGYIEMDTVESFIFGEQVEVIPERICYDMHKITEINIPNSVTDIGYRAFTQCEGLKSVKIGNGVINIGKRAFQNCYSLQEITIPNSVTTIGDTAFRSCHDLVNVIIGNWVTDIGSAAFKDCYSMDSATIGNNVANIGSGAFSNCVSLKNISFPQNIKSIGDRAFSSCTHLKSVKFARSVTVQLDYLGEYAFSNCQNLTLFSIFGNFNIIKKGTFRDCINLTEVSIGAQIDSIGAYAFDGCNLEKVICYAKTPPVLENSVFKRNEDSKKIDNLYVPYGSVDAYKESDWANYFTNILPKAY